MAASPAAAAVPSEMHRQTLILLIAGALLACAGILLVPQFFAADEPVPKRWAPTDEVEVLADPDATAEAATANPTERSIAEAADPTADQEARVTVVLRGRVVDKFQQPVADAKVWLDYGRGGQRGGPAARQRRIPDPVLTDGNGRFAFAGQTFRNLQVSLQVQHATHAPGLFDKYLGEVGAEVDLGDLVLARGGELVGRVTDLEGNAVPGATMTLQPENGNRLRFVRERDAILPTFTTDNNGWFRRSCLAAGDWSVTATAPRHTEGRSPTFVVEDEQTVELEDIRLGPGYEITGVVRDVQGAPIAKAEVRLRAENRDRENRPQRGGGNGASSGGPGGGREHRATTDAEGKFFLEHLPATAMTLDASADTFLDAHLEGIDPTLGQPVQVTLQDGLRITGTAIEQDGSPVAMFAVRANRVRGLPVAGATSLDPNEIATRMRDGTLDEATRQQLRAQFDDRRQRGGPPDGGGPGQRGQQGRELGKPEAHPRGEFVLGGLQEGIYEVQLQSPDHARYRSAEIEVRSGAVAPNVVAKLDHGVYVAGVVQDPDGRPVRGARVTLRTAPATTAGQTGAEGGGRGRARAAAFEGMMRQGMAGATALEATTDADGLFVVKHVGRGTFRLGASSRGFADANSESFDLQADRSDFLLQLGALGVLSGSVRNLGAGEFAEAHVGAVPLSGQGGPGFTFGRGGGQGGNPFHTVNVAADGTYRIDDLAPGGYVVRAWIGSPQELMRELMPKFFDGSVAPDATISGGGTTRLDLAVTRPQVGVVTGSVLHNGAPGSGMQVDLQRIDEQGGTADRGGRNGGPGGRGMFANFGRTLQTTVGASGQFRIASVPAGSYRLRVQAGRRGSVLHEEPIDVLADGTTDRAIVVTTLSLAGRVTDDSGDAKQLAGTVSLLPGVTTMPDNLGQWRRDNTTFDARVQAGAFRFDAVKPGSYLLVLTIRGRKATSTPLVVGVGAATEITIAAGEAAEAKPTSPAATNNPPTARQPAPRPR